MTGLRATAACAVKSALCRGQVAVFFLSAFVRGSRGGGGGGEVPEKPLGSLNPGRVRFVF